MAPFHRLREIQRSFSQSKNRGWCSAPCAASNPRSTSTSASSLAVANENAALDGPPASSGDGGGNSATRFEEGVRIDLDGLAQLDEEENDDADDEDEGALNVHRLVRNEKDGASYSLLVEGAVRDGDWAGAAAELKRMQAAGLHAGPRDLRSWAERGRDRADRPR